jgi:2-C-methyl-D-erythritol 2,4-cyclodiphosphate synthase
MFGMMKIPNSEEGMPKMRIGIGYDVHRLIEGRPLVLGGVTIPFEKGLLGHSDADVLTHAVCDAVLGALGLGDLGQHFPDHSPDFKNINSLLLLDKCCEMMQKRGYAAVNLDAVVMAQAPKIGPYKAEMEKRLAKSLQVPADWVNVKATTTEGLGFVGRGEGMAAECVVLVDQVDYGKI